VPDAAGVVGSGGLGKRDTHRFRPLLLRCGWPADAGPGSPGQVPARAPPAASGTGEGVPDAAAV